MTKILVVDDEADLQMIETEDHDPLECEIEIIAKPRGKRPHSIEMLSGGEKTKIPEENPGKFIRFCFCSEWETRIGTTRSAS